ncbi:MAG: glycosyltransferase [Chloroflexota bacterium]
MATRLRVLNIVGSLELAGTEQYILRVAPRLRRYGIDVELCVLDRRGPLLETAKTADIPVHATKARTRRSRSVFYTGVAAVLEIASLIRKERYDIVHSYLFHAEAVGTPAARLAGTRRVIISRRAVSPRRPEEPHYFVLETLTNLLADELIANSRAVLKDTEQSERLLPRTRTVIYNGVDPSEYSLARPGQDQRLRLVTVGVLAPRKGQEYALKALRLVRDAGIDARLTLVGDGPDSGRLRTMAQVEGIEDHVVFAGGQLDPRPFLVEADVFVLPSRQEGFSNALLEAMATALPVVATAVGGNVEAIVDGEGGWIVPPEDSAALAEALIRSARSREELATMGVSNRRRVESTFSLDSSVDQLAQWYRRSREASTG